MHLRILVLPSQYVATHAQEVKSSIVTDRQHWECIRIALGLRLRLRWDWHWHLQWDCDCVCFGIGTGICNGIAITFALVLALVFALAWTLALVFGVLLVPSFGLIAFLSFCRSHTMPFLFCFRVSRFVFSFVRGFVVLVVVTWRGVVW